MLRTISPNPSPDIETLFSETLSFNRLDALVTEYLGIEVPSSTGERIMAHETAFQRHFRNMILTAVLPGYDRNADESPDLDSRQLSVVSALQEIAMNIVDYEVWGLSSDQKRTLTETGELPQLNQPMGCLQNASIGCLVERVDDRLRIQFQPTLNTPDDFVERWHSAGALHGLDISLTDDSLSPEPSPEPWRGCVLAAECFSPEVEVLGSGAGKVLRFEGGPGTARFGNVA